MSRASATLILFLVAGCAAPRPGPPGRVRATPVQMFISPAGEPFRAGASSFTAWFTQADSNQDGRLSLAEFTADHQRFFKTLDLDGNGLLNGDEITRYETQVAPEIRPGAFRDAGNGQAERPSMRGQPPEGRGAGRATGGPGGGARGGGRGAEGPRGGGPAIGGGGGRAPAQAAIGLDGAARYGLLNDPEPVRAADTDIDFQVSAAEWTAPAQRRFGQLDRNHDGVLTREELHWAGDAQRNSGRGGSSRGRP